MMSSTATVHRILVAIDASPDSLAALEAAARLASEVGAELLGLFVEDESLLRGADLPLTRVVGSFTGVVRPLYRRDVEQQLRAQATKARQALETVAVRGRLRWSFRVLRGAVPSLLTLAASEADIMTLGRGRAGPGHRMGRTTSTILGSEGVPVLLLERGLRSGQAVVVVYDGQPGSFEALGFARLLAGGEQTPFYVALRGAEGQLESLENAAANDLKRLGVSRQVEFYRLGRGDASQLARLNRRSGIGVLVLPRVDALGKGVADLLAELRCPVLVIRRPTPEVAPAREP